MTDIRVGERGFIEGVPLRQEFLKRDSLSTEGPLHPLTSSASASAPACTSPVLEKITDTSRQPQRG